MPLRLPGGSGFWRSQPRANAGSGAPLPPLFTTTTLPPRIVRSGQNQPPPGRETTAFPPTTNPRALGRRPACPCSTRPPRPGPRKNRHLGARELELEGFSRISNAPQQNGDGYRRLDRPVSGEDQTMIGTPGGPLLPPHGGRTSPRSHSLSASPERVETMASRGAVRLRARSEGLPPIRGLDDVESPSSRQHQPRGACGGSAPRRPNHQKTELFRGNDASLSFRPPYPLCLPPTVASCSVPGPAARGTPMTKRTAERGDRLSRPLNPDETIVVGRRSPTHGEPEPRFPSCVGREVTASNSRASTTTCPSPPPDPLSGEFSNPHPTVFSAASRSLVSELLDPPRAIRQSARVGRPAGARTGGDGALSRMF